MTSLSLSQTAPKIFGGEIRTHLLAFYSSEDENAGKYSDDLKKVAKEFKGQVSVQTFFLQLFE